MTFDCRSTCYYDGQSIPYPCAETCECNDDFRHFSPKVLVPTWCTLAELLHGEEVFEYSADYNPNPKDYKYKRFGGGGIWPT
jgi:hypothetical protein